MKFKVGDTVICKELIMASDLWAGMQYRQVGHIGTVSNIENAHVYVTHKELIAWRNEITVETIFLDDELEIWEDPDLRSAAAQAIEKFLAWMANNEN